MGKNNDVKEYNADLFKMRLKEVSGKNQTQVARDMGINQYTFSHKLKGQKGSGQLTVDDLMQIAGQYHCSVDYLLGLSDHIAVNDSGSTSFAEIIKVFSALYDKGVFKLSDDACQGVEFCNDVFSYFCREISKYKRLLYDGTITSDNFNDLLNGLCGDFDYYCPNQKDLAKIITLDSDFMRFDAWKNKRGADACANMSERDLYKQYVRDVFLPGNISPIDDFEY